MKKKAFAALLAAVLCLGLLAGCGGTADTPDPAETPNTSGQPAPTASAEQPTPAPAPNESERPSQTAPIESVPPEQTAPAPSESAPPAQPAPAPSESEQPAPDPSEPPEPAPSDPAQLLVGMWQSSILFNDYLSGLETAEDIVLRLRLTFTEDGTIKSYITPEDQKAFNESLHSALVTYIYETMIAEEPGLTREAVDEQLLAELGMTLSEYAAETIADGGVDQMLAEIETSGTYFVEDGRIVIGEDGGSAYELKDGVLTIEGLECEGTPFRWTRLN